MTKSGPNSSSVRLAVREGTALVALVSMPKLRHITCGVEVRQGLDHALIDDASLDLKHEACISSTKSTQDLAASLTPKDEPSITGNIDEYSIPHEDKRSILGCADEDSIVPHSEDKPSHESKPIISDCANEHSITLDCEDKPCVSDHADEHSITLDCEDKPCVSDHADEPSISNGDADELKTSGCTKKAYFICTWDEEDQDLEMECQEMEQDQEIEQDEKVEEKDKDTKKFSIQKSESLASFPVDQPKVSYEIVEGGSQRGGPLLVDSSCFSYTKKRTTRTITTWICSVRNKTIKCHASVKQHGNTFRMGKQPHIHPPESGLVTKVKMHLKVKETSKRSDNVFRSAASMAEEVAIEIATSQPNSVLPTLANVVRLANRVRKSHRPAEPIDLNFDLALHSLPQGFFKKDIRIENQRHMIFATDQQLDLLSKAHYWYIDYTFNVIYKPFHLLLSVHAFLNYENNVKQVPLAFVLMSRDERKDYKKVFRALKRVLPIVPAVKLFTADFKETIWEALDVVFPCIPVKGCAFHWSRAIWRKVQDLDLQMNFNEEKGVVQHFMKKLFALPFLPHELITDAFNQLKMKASTPQLEQLVGYVEETWINCSTWPPCTWSVFMRSTRTKNDVEGWHKRLNKRAGRRNLNFYVLISLLHMEASLVPLQARLVSEKKLTKCRRKKESSVDQKLFELWTKFIEGEITTSQLLKRAGRLVTEM
ncbi:uncharacterized protein [Procambarus clarkii]|uniref:uncharacterized protein n=1 Tax=Procambarus clarkii TaxID=6728 RepID=UPI00374314E6